jgi:hypothetical protein
MDKKINKTESKSETEADSLPLMEEFDPTIFHVGFTVGKVALEQDFLLAFRFSSATVIPPLLCINLLSRKGTVFPFEVEILQSN